MKKFLTKIVDVKPDEIRALWLGFIFFFVVLAGYYVIRPIRDNIGATQFENLWWMFTVVLVAMMLISVGALVLLLSNADGKSLVALAVVVLAAIAGGIGFSWKRYYRR